MANSMMDVQVRKSEREAANARVRKFEEMLDSAPLVTISEAELREIAEIRESMARGERVTQREIDEIIDG